MHQGFCLQRVETWISLGLPGRALARRVAVDDYAVQKPVSALRISTSHSRKSASTDSHSRSVVGASAPAEALSARQTAGSSMPGSSAATHCVAQPHTASRLRFPSRRRSICCSTPSGSESMVALPSHRCDLAPDSVSPAYTTASREADGQVRCLVGQPERQGPAVRRTGKGWPVAP